MYSYLLIVLWLLLGFASVPIFRFLEFEQVRYLSYNSDAKWQDHKISFGEALFLILGGPISFLFQLTIYVFTRQV